MDAGEQGRIDNVRRLGLDDIILIALDRIGLFSRDKRAADIRQICPHRLRRQDRGPAGYRSRERHRPVEPFADFLHHGKRRGNPGMATRTRRHRDQAIGALLDCLMRITVVYNVVQGNPAPTVHCGIQILACAERRDRDRHLPFTAGCNILFQPVIRFMDDLVDCIRSRRTVGIIAIMRSELLGNLVQPFVQLCLRTSVQCRKRTDHAGLALGNHQFRPGNDEQGRADNRKAEFVENCRKSHCSRIPH